ncbi:MAG: hypothetical protein JJD92_15510 [Frankiaceae bacterium]|nr:hypothetical protein [Frankiaceae bacterium]
MTSRPAVPLHTIVMPLRPAGGDYVLLDRRFEAGFQCYRAVVREGRGRLAL